jgi:hypothetical protein
VVSEVLVIFVDNRSTAFVEGSLPGFRCRDVCGLASDDLAVEGGISFCLLSVLCTSFIDRFSTVVLGGFLPGLTGRHAGSLFSEDCVVEAEISFNTVYVGGLMWEHGGSTFRVFIIVLDGWLRRLPSCGKP